MILRSATASSDAGAEIRADGGVLSDPVPVGMAVGTTIEVRNLFFNTPVRRKYLKSISTEFGHLSEAVLRLAIPNFKVHFLLRHNGRVTYDLSPCEKMGERIGQIFGSETLQKLIPIDYREENLRVWGYVGHPDLSRGSAAMQYLFLNRRFFRDKSLQHALMQGYRGLLTVGRYPAVFLEIELPPDAVDCNIHPTKMEVRFLESQKIFSALLSAIREQFLRSDLRSRPAEFCRENKEENEGENGGRKEGPFAERPRETPQNSLDDTLSESARRRALDWTGSGGGSASTKRASGLFSGTIAQTGKIPSFRPFSDGGSFRPPLSAKSDPGAKPNHAPAPFPDDFPPRDDLVNEQISNDPPFVFEQKSIPPTAATAPSGRLVLQVQNRYLVMETDDGLAVIDQHALHERILYEKIKRTMTSGPLDSQRLLIPETVDLTPIEAAAALENREIFAEFGLPIDSFGGTTVLISGYPVILERLGPTEIFRTLLERLMNQEKEEPRSVMLESMMRQTACKAAIKGGDALRDDAITELLALAEQEINAHHCPHGRPSILTFSVAEIDKMFKRT